MAGDTWAQLLKALSEDTKAKARSGPVFRYRPLLVAPVVPDEDGTPVHTITAVTDQTGA